MSNHVKGCRCERCLETSSEGDLLLFFGTIFGLAVLAGWVWETLWPWA